jgi:hypothetical protein
MCAGRSHLHLRPFNGQATPPPPADVRSRDEAGSSRRYTREQSCTSPSLGASWLRRRSADQQPPPARCDWRPPSMRRLMSSRTPNSRSQPLDGDIAPICSTSWAYSVLPGRLQRHRSAPAGHFVGGTNSIIDAPHPRAHRAGSIAPQIALAEVQTGACSTRRHRTIPLLLSTVNHLPGLDHSPRTGLMATTRCSPRLAIRVRRGVPTRQRCARDGLPGRRHVHSYTPRSLSRHRDHAR